MPKMEPIIALYPNGLREFVAITSELMPNAGNNAMYTSGCPKNQNKCWYKIGLPPVTSNASPPMKMSLR